MSALINTLSKKIIILSLLHVHFLVLITPPTSGLLGKNISNKNIAKFQTQINLSDKNIAKFQTQIFLFENLC